MSPSITVLMPVYNAEQYIKEAVDSVLNQTFSDFEFIIINDGSTDGTLAILEGYAEKDDRIRLISRENKGLVETLNQGLRLAKAPLIARMDADDISLPDRFKMQYSFMQNYPNTVVLGGRCIAIDSDGDPLTTWNKLTSSDGIQDQHLNSLLGSAIAHPAMMYRKDNVLSVGGYRKDAYPAEDLDMLLRIAEEGALNNIDEVVLKYRVHMMSICATDKQRQNTKVFDIVNLARKRKGLEPLLAEVEPVIKANEKFGNGDIKYGWWALSAGYKKTALKYACRSIKLTPLSLESWRLFMCVLRGC